MVAKATVDTREELAMQIKRATDLGLSDEVDMAMKTYHKLETDVSGSEPFL